MPVEVLAKIETRSVIDMIQRENVKNEIEATLALVGHMKNLLYVWGVESYRQNLYPLDAFENKDWGDQSEKLAASRINLSFGPFECRTS